MIGWFNEAFSPEFMQRALLAGLLASAACAVVGTWVVLRGLTFLGDALAHGVVPGLALALLWGFSPILGAFVAALAMSGAVTLVTRRTRVREDTGIGLLFVGMLALGVIIISKSRSFTTDVQSLLFGDVLGVTWADLRVQAVAGGPTRRPNTSRVPTAWNDETMATAMSASRARCVAPGRKPRLPALASLNDSARKAR